MVIIQFLMIKQLRVEEAVDTGMAGTVVLVVGVVMMEQMELGELALRGVMAVQVRQVALGLAEEEQQLEPAAVGLEQQVALV